MRLTARDFPPGTPLQHFFAWNERRWRRDGRYRAARDPDRLPPPIAQPIRAAVGSPDLAVHAAAFAALEELARPPREGPRRILVIRLSAFGDFVQSTGPFAAIRRHHTADRITLLTTPPFVGFARTLGFFDEVMIDERPRPVALGAWLRLRRRLRGGRFDRVYDLQTSQRSSLYAWLMRPGLPEWSGIAWGCSHPHANLARDPQHTLDKQAEQLLMAGIHPTPLPALPPLDDALPIVMAGLDPAIHADARAKSEEGDDENGKRIVLLVPGSSPQHPGKRWPAARFAEVARQLAADGCTPVVVGTASEAPLAAAICAACPTAVDLTGRTDIVTLAALAQRAVLTIGNDTGVCHLAAAADCPVVVLFSQESEPAKCAPRGRLIRILGAPELADLPAERVIAEARDILGSPAVAKDEPPAKRYAAAGLVACIDGRCSNS